ncbi:hypothetical protein I317_03859 [Kwoniella heveanensis CBS 569]|nr:hypothetical protein I317_03859 [Kwoniella heveanensis CBS 569]
MTAGRYSTFPYADDGSLINDPSNKNASSSKGAPSGNKSRASGPVTKSQIREHTLVSSTNPQSGVTTGASRPPSTAGPATGTGTGAGAGSQTAGSIHIRMGSDAKAPDTGRSSAVVGIQMDS